MFSNTISQQFTAKSQHLDKRKMFPELPEQNNEENPFLMF